MGKPKGTGGCFYSGCTGAQLTELLRALALPVSGAKAEQVARLRAHPAAAAYADEARAGTLSRVTLEWVGARDGVTLDDLKEACRAAGLKVTGNKYALVLSLLRKAGPGGVSAADVAKPRAPSTKPEAPERIRERILAKCEADTENWCAALAPAVCSREAAQWALTRLPLLRRSNQRCNEHALNVFHAALKIMENEARTKGLLAARNPAVVDAAAAVLGALKDGWRSLCRPGYGDSTYTLGCIFDIVREVSDAMSAALPEAKRAELRALCGALHAETARYAMDRAVGKVETLFA